MNRTCVALLAVAVVGVGATPSTAQHSHAPRKAAAPYAAGAGIDCGRTLGCVTLMPKKGEKYVYFTVKDASGAPVYGTITSQPRTSPQVFGSGSEFCGQGSYLTNGQPVYVYFENHLGSWHGCPGGASRGVVHAEFFRR